MAGQKRYRAGAAHGTRQTTPRHLWLAALGLAAVTRRGLQAGLRQVDAGSDRLREDARRALADAAAVARGAAVTLREGARHAAPVLADLQRGLGSRLAPVFGAIRGGRASDAPRRPRKARPAKTPARPGGRGTGGRRKAATRVARKGRG